MGRSERVALVDTGAARSLISETIWQNYCEDQGYPLCVKVDTKLQAVTGTLIPLRGKREIEVEKTKIEVYISPSVNGIILGDDALKQLNAQINLKESFVRLKGKKFNGVQKMREVGEISTKSFRPCSSIY